MGQTRYSEFHRKLNLVSCRATSRLPAANPRKSARPDLRNRGRHIFIAILLLGLTPSSPAQERPGPAPEQELALEMANDNPTNTSAPEVSEHLAEAPSASVQHVEVLLSVEDRFKIYRHTILRPYSIAGPAFGAGIGQWENEPPEWGQGTAGYARRFASGMGRHLISETIRFGVAAVDGEDPRYYPSKDKGVWKRSLHAVGETFFSHTLDGGRMPAYSRILGTYGAAFIANSWYPNSRATTGYALRRGSTSLASSVGFHLFQEFFPRKKFKMLRVDP